MKRVAFVEFLASHTECIYSHLLYLKASGYYVEFICNETQKPKVAEIQKIADKTTFIKVEQAYAGQNCKYILEQRFDKVIVGSTFYNEDIITTYGLSAEQTANFFGVLHNSYNVWPIQITHPVYRQYISKINRFFVLADYIASKAPQHSGLTYSAIPLIFQPEYTPVSIEKPEGDIWVAIPGAIDFARRDYMALIPPEGETYAENIKFILLGKDYGAKTLPFRNLLKEHSIDDHFLFFEKYVEGAEFQSWIKKCDYVMPLVHEESQAFKAYLHVKITGNLNVALTYRKPMLCDDAFSPIPEYAAHSLFYRRDQLCRFVNSLEAPDVKQFYDDDFERTHSLDVLAGRYEAFLRTE